MQNLPRQIDPSLIQEGDTIIASFPKDAGVAASLGGKVARLRVSGTTTHFDTREGGTIFSWRVGDRSGIRVMLTSREPAKQIPLFDSDAFDQVRERIG